MIIDERAELFIRKGRQIIRAKIKMAIILAPQPTSDENEKQLWQPVLKSPEVCLNEKQKHQPG